MRAFSILFVLAYVHFPVYALDLDRQYRSWRIDGKLHRFLVVKSEGLVISAKCAKQVTKNCKAHEAIKQATMKRSIKGDDLLGGKNPGAVLCAKQFNGRVVYGLDRFENQMTFCLFDDSSLVATSTLLRSGRGK